MILMKLRYLHKAQLMYQQGAGCGSFSDDLRDVWFPEPNLSEAGSYTRREFAPDPITYIWVDGYLISLRRNAQISTLEAGFTLTARPSVQDRFFPTGTDCFFLDQTGVIRHSGSSDIEAQADSQPVNIEDTAHNTPLHNAVFGLPQMVSELIRQGQNINVQNDFGQTPLHEAVTVSFDPSLRHQRLEIVRTLLEQGAAVNTGNHQGLTPLHVVVHDYQEVLQLLTMLQVEPHQRQILLADCFQTIDVLVHHGANINARTVNGLTPLHIVVENTPDIARYLIEHGADVNACAELETARLYANENGGVTPLHLVQDPHLAQLLIEKGANVNAVKKDGRTPLFSAVESAPEIAKLLIANGANVAAVAHNHETPLHLVSDVEVAKLLVAQGTDLEGADKYETPLARALRRNNQSVAQFLRSFNLPVHHPPYIRLPKDAGTYPTNPFDDSELISLINTLNGNWEAGETYKAWQLPYNQTMGNIAARGEMALDPLLRFIQQAQTNRAIYGAALTVNLIGLDLQPSLPECEPFRSRKARKILLDLLSRQDLQVEILELLTRAPWMSDVPVLMEHLQRGGPNTWAFVKALQRYDLPGRPVHQEFPDDLKEVYSSLLTLLIANQFVVETEVLKNNSMSILSRLPNTSFQSALHDLTHCEAYYLGPQMEYYIAGETIILCGPETARRRWLTWYREHQSQFWKPTDTFAPCAGFHQ
ncbi:MAG: ankyrin repeat domain-containing protein [Acidobacteria bacterium]|nr:ankyrin repeat domain-containing protein [Acidobacteriota bacterium]